MCLTVPFTPLSSQHPPTPPLPPPYLQAMNVTTMDVSQDSSRPYLEWLAQLRKNEEILADLRICKCMHEVPEHVPFVRQYAVAPPPYHVSGSRSPTQVCLLPPAVGRRGALEWRRGSHPSPGPLKRGLGGIHPPNGG